MCIYSISECMNISSAERYWRKLIDVGTYQSTRFADRAGHSRIFFNSCSIWVSLSHYPSETSLDNTGGRYMAI